LLLADTAAAVLDRNAINGISAAKFTTFLKEDKFHVETVATQLHTRQTFYRSMSKFEKFEKNLRTSLKTFFLRFCYP